MSEILIKGMELPKEDDIVIMTLDSNGRVNVFGRRLLSLLSPHAEIHGLRSAMTEAIALPEHGRLGDLDALAEYIKNVYCKDCKRSKVMCKACEYGDIIDEIEDAPTIIEASKERE